MTHSIRRLAALGTALLCFAAAPAPKHLESLEAPTLKATRTADPVVPVNRFRRIVVDAGHGGRDSGAVSPWGTEEKHIALDTAKRLSAALKELGYEAVMTRDTDDFIELPDRAAIAGRENADLFVSVHGNASSSDTLRGFEVYVLSPEADDTAIANRRASHAVGDAKEAEWHGPSRELNAVVWALEGAEHRRQAVRAADYVLSAVRHGAETAAHRRRPAQFHVIKWSECPAILVEIGYLTNRDDERLLKSPLYRERLARAIAAGIAGYAHSYDSTNGFTK